MSLPTVPPSAVRFESHPDYAPRVVAIWRDGAWRVWAINLDAADAVRVCGETAAAIAAAANAKGA